jgi:hypothetical protein
VLQQEQLKQSSRISIADKEFGERDLCSKESSQQTRGFTRHF